MPKNQETDMRAINSENQLKKRFQIFSELFARNYVWNSCQRNAIITFHIIKRKFKFFYWKKPTIFTSNTEHTDRLLRLNTEHNDFL